MHEYIINGWSAFAGYQIKDAKIHIGFNCPVDLYQVTT
jgi:hypothetical protein